MSCETPVEYQCPFLKNSWQPFCEQSSAELHWLAFPVLSLQFREFGETVGAVTVGTDTEAEVLTETDTGDDCGFTTRLSMTVNTPNPWSMTRG